MKTMHTVFAFLFPAVLAASLTVAMPARAEVFKWVGEKGVVNYGNAPPKAAKASMLDPAAANVSTYSHADASKNEGLGGGEGKLKERVDVLEKALEAERRNRQAGGEPALPQSAQQQSREAERKKQERERCIADRRVDCDDPVAVSAANNAVIPLVVARNRPPVILPAVPITRPFPRPPVSGTPGMPRPRSTRGRDRD